MNRNNLLSGIATYSVILTLFCVLLLVTLLFFYPNQLAIKVLFIIWLFSCVTLGTSQILIK